MKRFLVFILAITLCFLVACSENSFVDTNGYYAVIVCEEYTSCDAHERNLKAFLDEHQGKIIAVETIICGKTATANHVHYIVTYKK